MAEQTIAPVATPQAATATIAAKAPEAAKAEPPKTEAASTSGTTAPTVGAGAKVNYYA